jgi:hypothetical protein
LFQLTPLFSQHHQVSFAAEHSGKRLASLLAAMATAAHIRAPSSLGSSFFRVAEKNKESDSESDSCAMSNPAPSSTLVVTDANACVGGLTLSLGRVFAKVNAVELDVER